MSSIIDGTTGITFPDASTQAKAVSQVTPFAVTASAIAGAELQLPEATANGVNYVAIKAANTLAANTTFTLPAADGTSGQVLQTNASGVLAFGNVAAANGGTGLTSSGTAGNLLTSNGTTWTSAAAPASGGLLNATATGSLADGSTVIINADGTVSVAGTTVTPITPTSGTPVVFRTASDQWIAATYDSAQQKVVIAYADVVSDGVNDAGQAIIGTVSGTSISFGTAVTFRAGGSGAPDYISIAYDSVNQKVVIAYRNNLNSNFGTAIVGTVSGTTISFGTPVVFESANTAHISVVYDTNAQKIVIAYMDLGNSNFGTAIVGTVSGTTISFGTAVVFESASAGFISAVYETVQQKIVIAYVDNGNSTFGTAIIGTVSGTTISFGTAVVFQSTNTSNISAVYDTDAQKIVVAYKNVGNSSFGTAIVGTVSGTTISFGTAVVFSSAAIAAATNPISAAYDTFAQRVIITFSNGGNSDTNTAIAGTVSGTSISFGTATAFSGTFTDFISSVYHPVQQKVVSSYRQGGPNRGFSAVITSATVTTNLTTENFIGFSNAAYTNGQTATIQLVGAVDDAQSGLTPGQSYFVQNNGSLGLTAGSPSVFAGTAVAANKIIVKG